MGTPVPWYNKKIRITNIISLILLEFYTRMINRMYMYVQ